jgi:glycine cleavage system H protein
MHDDQPRRNEAMSVEKRLFSKEHEWVEAVGDGKARIGITDFAQSELGDIVFVELPSIGASVEAGQSMGSIESVKTVSELYSPVNGKVTAVNERLNDEPELVNQSPYEDGWMVEVELNGPIDASELLTWEQYEAMIKG